MPPQSGSHIPPDDNLCIQCHGDPDLWDAKTKQLYIARDQLAQDVHWTKGVNCSDCHGGNPTHHRGQRGARQGERFPRCGRRAEDVRLLSREPKLGPGQERARQGRPQGRAGPRHAAGLRPVSRRQPASHPAGGRQATRRCSSTTRWRPAASATRSNWPATSTPCTVTVCTKSGLLVTATCANCHGAHGIYRAADARSTLFTGQRRRHLRQVPPLYRRTAASQRPRSGQRTG